MAHARSTFSAALALLLIGSAAESVAKSAPTDQSVGTTLSTTAAVTARASSTDVPRPWSMADRPRYTPGGWQCSPGLVWRNAGPRDWLCVDPQEASRTESENEDAASNWVDAADGSYTCRAGLVRREAFTRDVVCVDPVRRDAVRQMNAALYTIK
jgi:hypothetical protein